MRKMEEKREKDPAAVALGKKGGEATGRARTPQERSEACSIASKARWQRFHAQRVVQETPETEKPSP